MSDAKFGNGTYNYEVIKEHTESLFDEIPCDANVSCYDL